MRLKEAREEKVYPGRLLHKHIMVDGLCLKYLVHPGMGWGPLPRRARPRAPKTSNAFLLQDTSRTAVAAFSVYTIPLI